MIVIDSKTMKEIYNDNDDNDKYDKCLVRRCTSNLPAT